MKRIIIAVLICIMAGLIGLTGCQQESTESGEESGARQFATIGTGGLTGVYYPTGGAIAKMVNDKKDYNIKCSVESTGGSVFNINAVLQGDLDFGIAQSDRQFQAWNGLAEWEDAGPQKKLRSVFSIHPELVTLIAADDADINSLMDLKGKRVNIGNPGSGQRQNAIDALANAGIDWEKDLRAESVKAAEGPGLLQDDRIDAFFYTVGHPNGAIKEATAGRRKVHFVPITGVEALLEKNPYYAVAEIPIEFYEQATNEQDVTTFGVKATLICSEDTPDEVVYAITKEVFDNLDKFKTLHEAYKGLTRERMLEGLTAPLHPGAMKYYQEAGLK
ncbi:MAG: TAXI family TRAP transporter solute-binding subunit [Candidatus Sumerlaeia bacterium]